MKKLFNICTVLVIAWSVIYLSGCSTAAREAKDLKKAQDFFTLHPAELAKVCATKYPVKDSVGKPVIDSSHLAHNINYQHQIDSLKSIADQVQHVLSKADMTADQLTDARASLTSLNDKISQLQHNYKPCKPDTIWQAYPVYRENTARVDSLQNYIGQQSQKLTKALTDRDVFKNKASVRLWIILGFCLLALVFIIVKICL